jgi:hypothetical protein
LSSGCAHNRHPFTQISRGTLHMNSPRLERRCLARDGWTSQDECALLCCATQHRNIAHIPIRRLGVVQRVFPFVPHTYSGEVGHRRKHCASSSHCNARSTAQHTQPVAVSTLGAIVGKQYCDVADTAPFERGNNALDGRPVGSNDDDAACNLVCIAGQQFSRIIVARGDYRTRSCPFERASD